MRNHRLRVALRPVSSALFVLGLFSLAVAQVGVALARSRAQREVRS